MSPTGMFTSKPQHEAFPLREMTRAQDVQPAESSPCHQKVKLGATQNRMTGEVLAAEARGCRHVSASFAAEQIPNHLENGAKGELTSQGTILKSMRRRNLQRAHEKTYYKTQIYAWILMHF